MENHTDIETLLTKYFEGNTTPPENEQIEAWLNADEEHLRIAKQLNTLYLAVDTQHITKKIDTEKALDKVKSRTKVRNLSWWGWTQRIAAILSVPPPDRCIGSVSGQTAAGSHRSDGGNKNQCRHDYLRPVTGQHGSSPQFGILPPLSHLFCRRCAPSGIKR